MLPVAKASRSAAGSVVDARGIDRRAVPRYFERVFDSTVEDALARVESRNPVLNALLTVRADEARRDAAARAAAPARSPLWGVPYSLKDEWDTAGLRTTAGSMRYRDRVPLESSAVHRAFDDAGGVLIGKSNLQPPRDRLKLPDLGGPTRNPHDLRRTAGGSSGGAAAAVADGMVCFDWGSDIGGSIRMPAAFCGIYGLKLSSETWPISGFFPEVPPTL